VSGAAGNVQIARRHRAVSVVELLVVVVILLIFSTVTIISYHNMTRGFVARSQANEFMAVFALARELAITNSTSHRVVIDQDTRSFWIDRLTTGGAVDQPKISGTENYLPQANVPQITVGNTTIQGTGQAQIIFRPDSTADQATIHIVRQGANASDPTEYFTIRLFAATAKARIYPHEQR